MLQRRLKLGYARAARIVDEMENLGIVGPYMGSKPRNILITKEQWEAMRSGQTGQMNMDDYVDESDEVIDEEAPF
jgi:S-DNA-T family DNA segregation ATPase FtsK/SpoIIIE